MCTILGQRHENASSHVGGTIRDSCETASCVCLLQFPQHYPLHGRNELSGAESCRVSGCRRPRLQNGTSRSQCSRRNEHRFKITWCIQTSILMMANWEEGNRKTLFSSNTNLLANWKRIDQRRVLFDSSLECSLPCVTVSKSREVEGAPVKDIRQQPLKRPKQTVTSGDHVTLVGLEESRGHDTLDRHVHVRSVVR